MMRQHRDSSCVTAGIAYNTDKVEPLIALLPIPVKSDFRALQSGATSNTGAPFLFQR